MKKKFWIFISIILIFIIALVVALVVNNTFKNKLQNKLKKAELIESLTKEELIEFSSKDTITKYNNMPIIEKTQEKEKILCPGSAQSYEDAKKLAESSQQSIYNTTATIYKEKKSNNYYTFYSKNTVNNSDTVAGYTQIIVFKNDYVKINTNTPETFNFNINSKNIKEYMDLSLFLKTNSNPYYAGTKYLNSFIEKTESKSDFIYTCYYINTEKIQDASKTKSLTYITLYKSTSTINKDSKTITDTKLEEIIKIH